MNRIASLYDSLRVSNVIQIRFERKVEDLYLFRINCASHSAAKRHKVTIELIDHAIELRQLLKDIEGAALIKGTSDGVQTFQRKQTACHQTV